MKPLTIGVSVDGGEQVGPGGLPGWVASLMHEFGFQIAEAAFHRSIVFSNFPSGAWLGSSRPRRLAAAVGMVDQAGRRLFPLDGQTCDLPGKEIAHDGQIEPPLGGWHAGDAGRKPESRDVLLSAIAKARRSIDDIPRGRIASFAEIAEREAQGERPSACWLPLPSSIIAAIVDGTAPADLTVTGPAKALPHSWVLKPEFDTHGDQDFILDNEDRFSGERQLTSPWA
jgi:hypothetical protein